MNRLAPLLFALLLLGCATESSLQQRVARMHVGMTFEEATELLGKPASSSNMGALIVYDYRFSPDHPIALHENSRPTTSYYVIVGRDGRVRSFGPN
jgi:hypothetical protein